MRRVLRSLAATAAICVSMGAATVASAATINQFNKTTNDGVFTLSQAQADFLGYSDARFIGFYRVREGNGTTFNDGDTFNVTTMFNSVTSNASKILAFLNGENPGLTYTGGYLDPLGQTTVGEDNSYTAGVAFLFGENAGNIVFRGSSTYNGGQSRGDFDLVVPSAVPLPAAAWMLIAGLGGLAAFARRKAA
jgi:hypothetical protein